LPREIDGASASPGWGIVRHARIASIDGTNHFFPMPFHQDQSAADKEFS
jgi:hypothetical protein